MHRETQLSLRGCSIEVRWWNAESPATTIVLLHEGLGSVSMWRDFPAQLARRTGCPVMAYSRPGHGRSTRPRAALDERFMHVEAMETLPEVLDAMSLDRVVLFGHSDGGSIALIFAAIHSRRAAALILEAPHVFVEDVSIASIERAKHLYATTDLRARLTRYHGANVDTAFRGWNDVWLSDAFRGWNIEELLPRVMCPILLLQGEQDAYGTLAQVDAIAKQSGGVVHTQVLANCGHSPHRDQPEKVLAEAAAFLRRHSL